MCAIRSHEIPIIFIPCVILVLLLFAAGRLLRALAALVILFMGVVYVVLGPFCPWILRKLFPARAAALDLNGNGNGANNCA
jgi:hypothetical protein